MRITRSCIALAFVFPACAAIAQSGKEPASDLEIVAVRDNGVDVKLRSAWTYPVSVWVCDAPRRLDDLGYSVEALKGKTWVQLKPRQGLVIGDLPPKYLEIAPGETVSLPILISPIFLGISSGMRLRIVVHAWRTETNHLGITKPIGSKSFFLASTSFVWMVKPTTEQRIYKTSSTLAPGS